MFFLSWFQRNECVVDSLPEADKTGEMIVFKVDEPTDSLEVSP